MRILYIITQGECGGAQKNLLDTAVNMKKLGHKIFVATGQQHNINDSWLFNKLKEQGFKNDDLIILPNLQREINLSQEIKVFFSTYKLIKKIKPHLTHLHSTKAGIICSIAAKLANSKTIYTVHGWVFSEKISLIKKSIYIISEFIASFFRDLTVILSKHDKKIGKKFKTIRKNKNIIIYNGIDQNKKKEILDPETAKYKILNKIKLTNKPKKIIGVVANLYKNKGLKFLIDAGSQIFQSHPDTIIVIIGDGEEKNNLEKQIKDNSLNDNIFLVGNIDQADKYLKAFDLIILPSLKEGFPYILLESLLAEVPFISTKVGGIPEINEYNILEMVSSGNSSALSQTIINFLSNSNPSNLKINLPPKFTVDYMVNSLELAYKNIFTS